MTLDTAVLADLAAKARVSEDRPLELYCAHGVGWEEIVFEHHTVFGGHIDEEGARCRVTTGPEFDEHEMAEYVIAAANATPGLLTERASLLTEVEGLRKALAEAARIAHASASMLLNGSAGRVHAVAFEACTDSRCAKWRAALVSEEGSR